MYVYTCIYMYMYVIFRVHSAISTYCSQSFTELTQVVSNCAGMCTILTSAARYMHYAVQV